MIPLELKLTNFLSYRETVTVDLSGVHLAVISGANGAGKSTLLDAMTWTLFGKSRSRSDDDLVNRRAKAGEAAEVAFTFDMEGAIYRVIRSKQPNKTTNLELQVAQGDRDDQIWLSLTEGKLRETQAAVERVLRMNYDIFTNASFFLQGQADRFTTRTPNQRKEILAEVLGVSQWEAYREQAAGMRKEAALQLTVQERQLEEIQAELSEAAARQEALAEAEAEVATIRERLQLQQQLHDQMAQYRAAAVRQKDQLAGLAANLEQLQAELSRVESSLAAREQELNRHLALLEEGPSIRQRHEGWQQAAAELSLWQERREAYLALQQQRQPFEREVVGEGSRLRQELADLSAREQQVAEATKRRSALVDQQAELAERTQELEQQATNLAAQLEERQVVERELEKLLGERRLWEQEHSQLESRAVELSRRLEERAVVESNVIETRHRLERQETALDAADSQLAKTQSAALELGALETSEKRLRADMDRLQMRITQLEDDAGSTCPLCGQELTPAHREEVIRALQADGKGRGDEFRANKARQKELKVLAAQLAGAEARKQTLVKEVDGLRQRLATADLTLQEIERLEDAWEKGADARRLSELKGLLGDDAPVAELRARLAALESAAQAARDTESELQRVRTATTQLAGQLAQIDETATAWERDGRPRLLAVREMLESGRFATEARQALAELDEQVMELGFDQAGFETIRARESDLSAAREAFQALKEAEAAVSPVREAVADLRDRRERVSGQLAIQQRQHEEAAVQLAEMEALTADWRAIEAETVRLQTELSNADQQLGASRQRVQVLGDREEQAAALREQGQALNLHIQRLRRLEEACGRKGVQALLIDHALPEIEEHANSLLDRLTGGEMRVSFETQRRLKSRDEMAETLDITIQDSYGERPYENYSGGEQFRVDFAIRLALSQVLAQRAGAKLRTLVIDEGFGSQDPLGRQRLVEAINTVQSEFDCILVITHIAELRDAFPARIVVEKGERGSSVQVNVM